MAYYIDNGDIFEVNNEQDLKILLQRVISARDEKEDFSMPKILSEREQKKQQPEQDVFAPKDLAETIYKDKKDEIDFIH